VAQGAFSAVSYYFFRSREERGRPMGVASEVSWMEQVFFLAGCYANPAFPFRMF